MKTTPKKILFKNQSLAGNTDIKNKNFYGQISMASIIINLLTILSIYLLRDRLPPEVPIFYGSPEGEQQLGELPTLAVPSLISLTITVFNLLLTLIIKNDYLRKVLLFAITVVSLLSVITTIRIMLLVGYF